MFNSLMDLKKCWLYSESYNSKKNYFLSINQSKMILKQGNTILISNLFHIKLFRYYFVILKEVS